jgi:hypothetical protein
MHIYEDSGAVDQLADADMAEEIDRRAEVSELVDAIYAAPFSPELRAILLKITELTLQ